MKPHIQQILDTPILIIDVESIGLHGTGYAVAGEVYIGGVAQPDSDFVFACDITWEPGHPDDKGWVIANIPQLPDNCESPYWTRNAFWVRWEKLKSSYPGIIMAGECIWPVEAKFLEECILDKKYDRSRTFAGPYPFHEIASFMLAAGMDPMATYDRLPAELPKHDPLADVRQSARLLYEALNLLGA